MRALRAKFVSLRDLLATAWPIVLVSAVALYVAYQFVEPAPPKRMVVSTGSEDGAYHAFATRYAELLAHNGIELEIRSSSGSGENLERLRRGEVDLAFVQGGVDDPARPAPFAKPVPGEVRLKTLGSVAYEPVWVFYRHERRIDTLQPLAGKRLAVGESGSGVRGVVTQLLAANGMATQGRHLLPITGLEAAEALLRGDVDAAFIVSAPEGAVVQALLHAVGVRVMSFGQAEAYARRFSFLSRIVLPRGVVDLERDIPPRDTALLATTANVVVRDTLHPALASLLLQAMSEVNGQTGFFQRAGEFPAYKDRSYELSDDAQRYFKSGPPFLQRYLPFWLAVLVERLLVLIVPVLVLIVPLLRMAPSIYSWRVRSKIFRCYGDLKFLENELRENYDGLRHGEYLERLDRIEDEAYARSIPLAFSDLLYTLRQHIDLVRDRLRQLERRHLPERTR